MPQIKPDFQSFAKIKVVGIGGAGGNAISRMGRGRLERVDFVAVNTDTQDLHQTLAKKKIHIGKNLTHGLGAGMNPEIGRQAAEEDRDEILETLKGADMIFITAGLGGGTGSGAGPVVAEISKEIGALVIGVVTKPFTFEGMQRARIAEDALAKLREHVDALIVIPNDRIFHIIDKETPLLRAFEEIDEILKQAVLGISNLITRPGIINVDFADVKVVMQDAGSALVGIGQARGEDRAVLAAKAAISSPLLETSIDGAKGVLFCVSGNDDLGMLEVQDAAKVITENIDPEAKVIFGAVRDPKLKKNEAKIIVIATGFDPFFTKINNHQQTLADTIKEDKKEESLSSKKKIKSEEVQKPTEKKESELSLQKEEKDIWDIPAFLRKKK